MPTIEADVMVGVVVDVPMIKWFERLELVYVGFTWLSVRLGGGV